MREGRSYVTAIRQDFPNVLDPTMYSGSRRSDLFATRLRVHQDLVPLFSVSRGKRERSGGHGDGSTHKGHYMRESLIRNLRTSLKR